MVVKHKNGHKVALSRRKEKKENKLCVQSLVEKGYSEVCALESLFKL